MGVLIERQGYVTTVVLDRPERRNAVDGETAAALAGAMRQLDADDTVRVIVLTGAGGTFCAGADLQAMSNPLHRAVGDATLPGPMGPTRLTLDTPVVAAIEGYAVAGGLELAAWCDLRVMARDATVGVFCRRWGVPLIDGGTVRLPRIVGLGRAMDWILTGRPVDADEALAAGFATRLAEPGGARAAAEELAAQIAAFPQACVRSDRRSVYDAFGHDELVALGIELDHGLPTVEAEALAGAQRFAGGAGRHGEPG